MTRNEENVVVAQPGLEIPGVTDGEPVDEEQVVAQPGVSVPVEEVIEEPVEEVEEEVEEEIEEEHVEVVTEPIPAPAPKKAVSINTKPAPEVAPAPKKVAIPADPVEDEEEEDPIDITIQKTVAPQTEETTEDENELETDEGDSEEDESLKMLKKQITEKIKPVSKKFDVSGFSVASKPTVSNAVIQTREISTAKWVLPSTGITFMVKELLGSDLERLRMVMQGNDARGTLQTIYDAITSPKPSFEKWLKTIAFDDYDHLFMGLYIAAFNGANFMPIDCTNAECKVKNFITDDVPFTKMIKYKDDEAKKEFARIYREEPIEAEGLRVTEIVPVSQDYAIGFTLPSLYSIMIESGYFDTAFQRKYASAISIAPYVDKFYQIDWNSKQFIPVECKTYVNNDAKTAKAKITKYSKILSTMSSDEIAMIRAYMESVSKNADLITYIQPECTCPHCGTVVKEQETTAASALFLRQQLSLLVNM